ncbi:MAG: hypothetical protein GY803_01700 [Chloroflexi bacterium]|nr:hypothetical protein [Chloroflexota bacterium]
MSKKKTTPDTPPKTGNDLDQLRHILYGNQTRATEQRLNDLEARLENVRRELSDDLNERAASLSGSASAQLTETRQALNEQIDQTTVDFSQRLDKLINDLRQGLADFRTEARQRDDDLRQEMLALGAMLDKQKAGRGELGEALVQLGRQLQENTAASSTETRD